MRQGGRQPAAGASGRGAGIQGGAHHDRGSRQLRGDLTDDPEIRSTEDGIARAMFRVAVSGRREQEASFFTVIVWRDQAEHASARSGVEVVAEELGASLRWATATTTRATRRQGE